MKEVGARSTPSLVLDPHPLYAEAVPNCKVKARPSPAQKTREQRSQKAAGSPNCSRYRPTTRPKPITSRRLIKKPAPSHTN